MSALALYRNEIIAGGWFHTIGGDSAAYVARWDGKSWHPLGGGVSGPVLALLVHENHLIAGGTFTYADGKPVQCVAEWDGGSWRPLDSGVWQAGDHGVIDLEIYDGRLVACGRFSWAGDIPARSIAVWTGEGWEALDSGLSFEGGNHQVNELALWNGQLIAAGNFDTVDGQKAKDLAIWNGNRWRPLTPLLNMTVNEMAVDEGRLVVGGSFFDSGQFDQSSILQWDGTRWLRMGTGLWSGRSGIWELPGVTAMTRWNNALHVAGRFRFAGDRPSYHIARWDGAAFDTPPQQVSVTAVPNPARDQILFGWWLDEPGDVELRVFNVLGREVARPVSGFRPGGPGEVRWTPVDHQGRPLPSGVYFARFESEGASTVQRVVVLR